MTARRIDEQIREHYAAQAPSPEALLRLQRLIAARAPRSGRRRRLVTAAAAAGVVLLLAPLAWLALTRASPAAIASSRALADQAAAAHNAHPELELRATSFAALRAGMKSLDFSPIEPRKVRETRMRLVGARYTTLAGAMAAQLVYLDTQGVPCTLYQARPVGALERAAPGRHLVDGLEVTIWREKGLLMVLARPLA